MRHGARTAIQKCHDVHLKARGNSRLRPCQGYAVCHDSIILSTPTPPKTIRSAALLTTSNSTALPGGGGGQCGDVRCQDVHKSSQRAVGGALVLAGRQPKRTLLIHRVRWQRSLLDLAWIGLSQQDPFAPASVRCVTFLCPPPPPALCVRVCDAPCTTSPCKYT